ncbi:Glycosyltransferase [Psidium guajava]|nr:Glycosyltransferase [Psidium guajava]
MISFNNGRARGIFNGTITRASSLGHVPFWHADDEATTVNFWLCFPMTPPPQVSSPKLPLSLFFAVFDRRRKRNQTGV